MSAKPLFLNGINEPSSDEGLHRKWRKEKEQLEDKITDLERQIEQEKRESSRLLGTVHTLRQYLNPQYRALRILFGEIEVAVGEESAGAAASTPGQQPSNASDPRWESYKQTFPGVAARIIDALLSHQQMTYGQLKTLLRADYNTIKNAAAKLRQAGAVVKEGTMCRLNR